MHYSRHQRLAIMALCKVQPYSNQFMPSVLWRCWLGDKKGIRPVKYWVWGAGMVVCLQQGADLHTAQLMPLPLTISCFSKIQIGFTFLLLAHPGSPGQKAVKHVCVRVMLSTNYTESCCWESQASTWELIIIACLESQDSMWKNDNHSLCKAKTTIYRHIHVPYKHTCYQQIVLRTRQFYLWTSQERLHCLAIQAENSITALWDVQTLYTHEK